MRLLVSLYSFDIWTIWTREPQRKSQPSDGWASSLRSCISLGLEMSLQSLSAAKAERRSTDACVSTRAVASHLDIFGEYSLANGYSLSWYYSEIHLRLNGGAKLGCRDPFPFPSGQRSPTAGSPDHPTQLHLWNWMFQRPDVCVKLVQYWCKTLGSQVLQSCPHSGQILQPPPLLPLRSAAQIEMGMGMNVRPFMRSIQAQKAAKPTRHEVANVHYLFQSAKAIDARPHLFLEPSKSRRVSGNNGTFASPSSLSDCHQLMGLKICHVIDVHRYQGRGNRLDGCQASTVCQNDAGSPLPQNVRRRVCLVATIVPSKNSPTPHDDAVSFCNLIPKQAMTPNPTSCLI